jgi:hypothetical protein
MLYFCRSFEYGNISLSLSVNKHTVHLSRRKVKSLAMKKNIPLSVGFALLCTAVFVSASTPVMPVSEIEKGMKGIGKTVFEGDEVESFDFEVVDIIPNFRPKNDLILVKLLGEKVEMTGVVAGMSGSPMYIDDRLIGALSYRIGLFQKEPIAGVTPIDQMLKIFDQDKNREQEMAAARGLNPVFVENAVGVRDFNIEEMIPPAWRNLRHASVESWQSISPIELPLFFSGFEDQVLAQSSRIFGGLGIPVFQGGGSTTNNHSDMAAQLQPGDAYSAILVDGDITIQATGTVTHVDGDRVVGMGHPFLNSGAIGLPMGKAKILTTLSSLMASNKMASLADVVGTIHQDRSTGVMGVLGEKAKVIPVKLNFESELHGNTEFNFAIAEDRSLYSFTPLIFAIVLNSAIESARTSQSNQTLVLDGKINLSNADSIPIVNYYAGSTPDAMITDALEAIGEVAGTVGTLLVNDFKAPQIESVELNFKSYPHKKLASIQRISANRTVVRPGDEVRITVVLSEYQGKESQIQHTIKLPETLEPGRISVYAGSGGTLSRLEYRVSPQKFRPTSFRQLLQLLNERRRNNQVFFQVRKRDQGLVVEGEELPGLPPSVLTVMNMQRMSGNMQPLRDRVIFEQGVPTDYSVSSGRTLLLTVKPKLD